MKILNWYREGTEALKEITRFPEAEAREILYAIFKKPYYQVRDSELTENKRRHFIELVKQRVFKRTPLSYLVQNVEFMGLEFIVSEGVFIPRQDTERIVEKAIELIPDKDFNILDIGTGTGNMLLSILYYKPYARGVGIDINPQAIKTAKTNAEKLELEDRAKFLLRSLFDFKDFAKYDMVISNPPYVSLTEFYTIIEPEVKKEPFEALVSPLNGIFHLKSIIKKAKFWLKDNGILILETGALRARTVYKILEVEGYKEIEPIEALSGNIIGIKARVKK